MLRKILTIIGCYILFQSAVLAAEALSPTPQDAGRAFLTQNEKKPGVHALPSGLQYKVIEKGDDKGVKAGPTDFVTVNYRGTLIDGTEFDSSYKRNATDKFCGECCYSRVDRGIAINEPRRQMDDLCSCQTGVWNTSCRGFD
jgi:hypothetical protein